MNVKDYNFHIFSLTALFTLGNAIIALPLYKTANPINLLISAVFGFVLVFLASVLINISFKRKVFFSVVCLLVCFAAIYGFVTSVFDYVSFIKAVQLPQTNWILISVALFVVVILFTISSNSAILKYSLLVAPFCAIMLILNFLGGLRDFDFSQIKVALNKPVFFTGGFLWPFCSLAVPILFVFLSQKKTATKAVAFGTGAGFLSLALCLAQSVFTLGVADDIEYPYIKAISVISSGSLFTRLDGMTYFIFFVTALIKAAVCTKTVVLVIKHLTQKSTPR